MAADATLIFVGAGGIIYGGTGTLPTNATTEPTTNWTDLGHVTADGVTETNSKSTTQIRNWYGTVVREITSEQTFQLSFALMETSAAVLAAYYGDVDATATAWEVKAVQGVRQKWIIDAVDGLKTRRLVVPDAQVVETTDVTSATSDAIVYGVTLTCYPDGNGVVYFGYTDDGVV